MFGGLEGRARFRRKGSSRVAEADLTGIGLEVLVGEREIPKTLQEALGNVLEAAEEANGCRGVILGKTPKQTAHLEHLREQMGNLHQVVEGFHHVGVGAVGVLKVQTAVLLEVK